MPTRRDCEKIRAMYSTALDAFCTEHRLPGSFRQVIAGHYVPLAKWLLDLPSHGTPIIGVSGAQGTGKSTLAEFLSMELQAASGWSVAVLSMDDFYLSRARRLELSRRVHPLLATRGPPGTHDTDSMKRYLRRLKHLERGEVLALPRFDKACDDHAAQDSWPTVVGPMDAIFLEGWCLGVPPQKPGDLLEPVNELEAHGDPGAHWRNHVNNRLRDDYAQVFSQLDRLIFLQAPDMEAVLRWRGEQERKLAAGTSPDKPGVMTKAQLRGFVQHFERLTRVALDKLPAIADVTLVLERSHGIRESRYRR